MVSGLSSSILMLTVSSGFAEVDESAFHEMVPNVKESLPTKGTCLSLSECFYCPDYCNELVVLGGVAGISSSIP